MGINRSNIEKHLVEYQLDMIGKTFSEAQKDDMWFFNWTMTQQQADQFKAYAIPLIKKVLRCNKSNAERAFSKFNLDYGLRVKD